MRLLPRILSSIYVLRYRTPSSPIYLAKETRKPFPYREYSSYPAEGKVSFS